MTDKYEKTLKEANAQCHKIFQEELNNWLEKQKQEWAQQLDDDEQAIEDFNRG